jgi:hypothetical protein
MTMLIYDDDIPLLIPTNIASLIGLNEAIVLQQVHYWITKNGELDRVLNYKEDCWWTYNTYEQWQVQFPFWSTRTIQRIFRNLEKTGLIIAKQFDKSKWKQHKWYTIDYGALYRMVRGVSLDEEEAEFENRNNGSGQVDIIDNTGLSPSTTTRCQHPSQQVDAVKDDSLSQSINEAETTAETSPKTSEQSGTAEAIVASSLRSDERTLPLAPSHSEEESQDFYSIAEEMITYIKSRGITLSDEVSFDMQRDAAISLLRSGRTIEDCIECFNYLLTEKEKAIRTKESQLEALKASFSESSGNPNLRHYFETIIPKVETELENCRTERNAVSWILVKKEINVYEFTRSVPDLIQVSSGVTQRTLDVYEAALSCGKAEQGA